MRKLLYISLVFFLFACKKKDPVVQEFTTDLELLVTDDNGSPLENAEVRLYDNASTYDSAALGFDVDYVAISYTDSEGKVIFLDLSESIKYYFLASLGNITNQTTDFTLKNNLVKGAVTTAVIELESVVTKLAFWTGSTNGFNLPIRLEINEVYVGDLSTTRSIAPTTTDTVNAFVRNVPPGEVVYKAIGSGGCYWEEKFTIGTGQFVTKGFNSCNTGSVVFYSKHGGGITVTLSQTDEVGTIQRSTPPDKTPTCEKPEGGLVVERPAGNYIYKAVSQDGCFWSGEVEITSDGCTSVELSDCSD